MATIDTRLKLILDFNPRKATRDAINWGPNTDIIEDMNKAQLLDGKKANGEDMPKYEQFTLKNKPSQFIPSNKSYSLKDKGKLHNLIIATANMSSLSITSTDSDKNEKLQHNGPGESVKEEEAFGLTEENRDLMNKKLIIPFMHRRLRGEV